VTDPVEQPARDGNGQGVSATIVELLPSATFRVKLENERLVLAHAAGPVVSNFVRLRPGDRVEVELSPYDRTRGRIVRLLKEG
jgi:translation initiation factor IF-1